VGLIVTERDIKGKTLDLPGREPSRGYRYFWTKATFQAKNIFFFHPKTTYPLSYCCT
jgi:hypothetical protein